MTFLDWPGKSPLVPGGVAHPAVYHMLDVAAVAELLAPPLPDPRRRALIVLVALHDLGKINAAFRAMLERGQPQHMGSHWEVSEALLRLHDPLLAAALGGTPETRRQLVAATAGHHGRPPVRDLEQRRGRPVRDWRAMLDAAGDQAVTEAGEVITALAALWPGAALDDVTDPAALSWRLAGLVTMADWIGSNIDWFPPCPAGPDLLAYLDRARGNAARAVAQAGVTACPPATGPLFDFPPRPMQQAAQEISLPPGPVLALLEDDTGSGKTEAALILARRMLSAGKGAGLYLALPTMATADAMFARIFTTLPRLLGGAPSLTLAHGRAALSHDYRDLRQARALNPDEPGPTDWLADSRRRALLANVGIGTVDQALLAVVKARHAALRLFGLSSKLLIVDEVHEMGDPYMAVLMETLLQAHAAQGGSAILLTATLPLELRARLVGAFHRGAGQPVPALADPAWPALTLGAVQPVAARPAPRGPVAVRLLADRAAALDLLADAAGQGAGCVLVCNAVDSAIAAHLDLTARGVATDLLHARFALCDRKRIESAALATHGKDRAARPGRVLVATQVVESSLDLDFDVMVSDLAPMASLIQRAGRLWRHMDRRPADTRPLPGPVLHVIAPDPGAVDGPDWAVPALGPGAHVYEVGVLWRTARLLADRGEIRAPDDLRALIEGAHGDTLALPNPLTGAELRALGQQGAGRALAGQNIIQWHDGYRTGAAGAGDADYPTRLGRPQTALVLMRAQGEGQFAPWSGGAWSVDSCQLSEVSAATSRLNRLSLPPSAPPPGLPEWLCATRLFVAVGQGGAICPGLRYDPAHGLDFD